VNVGDIEGFQTASFMRARPNLSFIQVMSLADRGAVWGGSDVFRWSADRYPQSAPSSRRSMHASSRVLAGRKERVTRKPGRRSSQSRKLSASRSSGAQPEIGVPACQGDSLAPDSDLTGRAPFSARIGADALRATRSRSALYHWCKMTGYCRDIPRHIADTCVAGHLERKHNKAHTQGSSTPGQARLSQLCWLPPPSLEASRTWAMYGPGPSG